MVKARGSALGIPTMGIPWEFGILGFPIPREKNSKFPGKKLDF